jgi:DNA-binding LacI/PurR family transcriptional regulator
MPRYYQVYSSLLERIRAGEFPPGSVLPPERQLSDEYGVSRITAIKSLDMLELDGYVERRQGRGTFALDRRARDSSPEPAGGPLLAFVSPEPLTGPGDIASFPTAYITNVLTGVLSACGHHGFSLLFPRFVRSSDDEIAAINDALAHEARGILLYAWPDYDNVAFIRDLRAGGLPIVLVDRYYPQVDTDYVVFDDIRASFELTQRLIERGHRRIAFVPSRELVPTTLRDRVIGYRQAIEAAGLGLDEDMIWVDMAEMIDSPDPSQNRAHMEILLRRRIAELEPSAIITVNHDVARVIGPDLRSLGVQVETATVSHLTPSQCDAGLSALAYQDGFAMGQQAAELLISRMQGDLPPEPRHVVLPMFVYDGPTSLQRAWDPAPT